MQKFHSVMWSIIVFVLMSQTQGAYALTVSEVTCPTVEQLRDFNYKEASISKYIKSDHTAIFNAAFDKDNGDDSIWYFDIESMNAKADDNLQDIAQASLEKLALVSPTPFLTESFFGIFEDSYDVPVCIYTSTENDSITAFARFIDFSDHDGTDSDREEIKRRLMAQASQKLHK